MCVQRIQTPVSSWGNGSCTALISGYGDFYSLRSVECSDERSQMWIKKICEQMNCEYISGILRSFLFEPICIVRLKNDNDTVFSSTVCSFPFNGFSRDAILDISAGHDLIVEFESTSFTKNRFYIINSKAIFCNCSR